MFIEALNLPIVKREQLERQLADRLREQSSSTDDHSTILKSAAENTPAAEAASMITNKFLPDLPTFVFGDRTLYEDGILARVGNRLGFLSQYPKEEELVFPPGTMLTCMAEEPLEGQASKRLLRINCSINPDKQVKDAIAAMITHHDTPGLQGGLPRMYMLVVLQAPPVLFSHVRAHLSLLQQLASTERALADQCTQWPAKGRPSTAPGPPSIAGAGGDGSTAARKNAGATSTSRLKSFRLASESATRVRRRWLATTAAIAAIAPNVMSHEVLIISRGIHCSRFAHDPVSNPMGMNSC